jgi:DNA repair protein RadC
MSMRSVKVARMNAVDCHRDPGVVPSSEEARLAAAKWLYWSRGLRSQTLTCSLFGEPAWDLLLDLYIREKSGSRSSVTSACIGSRAPHTTALRHISALCRTKWISRVPDDADKRRYWLALTPNAVAKLDRHFDHLVATKGFVAVDIHLLE